LIRVERGEDRRGISILGGDAGSTGGQSVYSARGNAIAFLKEEAVGGGLRRGKKKKIYVIIDR